MWYEWDSADLFNVWHDALCLLLGYPLIGINQGTGLPDENAQKTTAYTIAHEVESKYIAWVALEYGEGLIPTDLRLPEIVRD